MSLICIYGKEETHKVRVLTIEVFCNFEGWKESLYLYWKKRESMWVGACHLSAPSLICLYYICWHVCRC
jgi:hypothetical protein